MKLSNFQDYWLVTIDSNFFVLWVLVAALPGEVHILSQRWRSKAGKEHDIQEN